MKRHLLLLLMLLAPVLAGKSLAQSTLTDFIIPVFPGDGGGSSTIFEPGGLFRRCISDALSIWDSTMVNNSKSTMDRITDCQSYQIRD